MTRQNSTRRKTTNVAILLLAFVAINLGLAALSANPSRMNEEDDLGSAVLSNLSVGPVEPVPPHTGLKASPLPQLQLLGEYEQRLNFGFEEAMFFVDIPEDKTEATAKAKDTAMVLKEFSNHNITPLVIFEPENLNIENIELAPIKIYFSQLRAQGVTDETIGIWTPFPEPNIPEWSAGEDLGNTSPESFKKNYMQTAAILKAEFPESKSLVLLNAASYKSGDVEYQQGPDYSAETLKKYVEGLPKELVDETALQGFPWAPNDFKPDGGYLDAELAIMLGNQLDVDKVRLVTGTFSRMYDTTLAPQARKIILNDITAQAKQVQAEGFEVQFDIFAEDKYDQVENADWSYDEGNEWEVFEEFVKQSHESGMKVTIFNQPY